MKAPTDLELDASIARMLLVGIVLSAIVVIAGAGLELRSASPVIPDYSHFHATSVSLRTITGVIRSAIQLNADGVIQLGLLLLIATPIARVIFCVVGFARQRDVLYVGVSTAVLAILIYSLVRVSL